jgi:peptidyl-prolyl cis-trans isomerase D
MIAFFRRALTSWMALALLGLVLVAVAVTGVGTPGGMGLGDAVGASDVAKIGGRSISSSEISQRMQSELQRRRGEEPGYDMTRLVRSGGFDEVVDSLIDLTTIEVFGEGNGIVASKRLIDGEIASIPAFQGATGQFDQARYLAALNERGMSEALFRNDAKRTITVRHVLVPVTASPGAPGGVVAPYAALAFERRTGAVAAVPASAVPGGPALTEQDIATFYQRNAGRYAVPELRAIRYATFDRGRFEGKVVPSDADIAAYYKANAAKYAPREVRGITRVVALDKALADGIAAKVKAGQSMADAARAAGLQAVTAASVEKAALAGQSSAAVADAAFAAARGSVVGPIKAGASWHVVKVDTVSAIAGRTVDQARGEILPVLTRAKVDEALANFDIEIQNAIDDGKAFADIVREFGLTAHTTPDVTASGIAPNVPGFKAAGELPAILRAAFQAEQGDDPEIIQLAQTAYAVYVLDRIVPSAPKPLAQIRDQVAADAAADRAARAARRVAEAIMQKANRKTPFAQAVAGAGVSLPAPQPVSTRRIDIAQAGAQVPPPVAMLFKMAPQSAKLVEMPGKKGWFVVWLDTIQVDMRQVDPRILVQTQRELADLIGQEYSQQFAAAAKAELKVKRNDSEIARLKRDLTGAR